MSTKAYAVRLKDKNQLLRSSSGGAFSAISDVVLSNGGAIVSAVYNYQTHQNEFKLYESKEIRNRACGSKYMQAKPLNSFNEAYMWLKSHRKWLLFVGTGCQAEGFRRFTEQKGIRSRVIIVDIICHGSPSPRIWREYIKETPYDFLTFKDKRNGWSNPTAYVRKDGEERSISDYVTLFNYDYILRHSCYICPYATTERKVDLTIGDFWGIDKVLPNFYSEYGNSLVLVHTEKGGQVFASIKQMVKWEECEVEDCLQPNLISATKKPVDREIFWYDYCKKGLSYILREYGTEKRPGIIKKLLRKAKREKLRMRS